MPKVSQIITQNAYFSILTHHKPFKTGKNTHKSKLFAQKSWLYEKKKIFL